MLPGKNTKVKTSKCESTCFKKFGKRCFKSRGGVVAQIWAFCSLSPLAFGFSCSIPDKKGCHGLGSWWLG